MTDHQRAPDSPDSEEQRRIVISGLDEPEPGRDVVQNVSPTDDAAERHKLQHPRHDPEDEDG
ncbi:hypothetical protein [Deinococcus sonorensis]|uniref:Multidrug transporter n=2 Tax=Deinococcus sonorensis TaxID=309891 RepID=A0AAU7UAR5_9DEIO